MSESNSGAYTLCNDGSNSNVEIIKMRITAHSYFDYATNRDSLALEYEGPYRPDLVDAVIANMPAQKHGGRSCRNRDEKTKELADLFYSDIADGERYPATCAQGR